jgi:hypothetical protein
MKRKGQDLWAHVYDIFFFKNEAKHIYICFLGKVGKVKYEILLQRVTRDSDTFSTKQNSANGNDSGLLLQY